MKGEKKIRIVVNSVGRLKFRIRSTGQRLSLPTEGRKGERGASGGWERNDMQSQEVFVKMETTNTVHKKEMSMLK